MANVKNPGADLDKSPVQRSKRDMQESAPKKPAKKPMRQVETVAAFARRTGQAYKQQADEITNRTPLSNIQFPKNIRNMSALRFALRVNDAVLVTVWLSLSSCSTPMSELTTKHFLRHSQRAYPVQLGFVFLCLWSSPIISRQARPISSIWARCSLAARLPLASGYPSP